MTTVAQLIEYLKTFPQDEICINNAQIITNSNNKRNPREAQLTMMSKEYLKNKYNSLVSDPEIQEKIKNGDFLTDDQFPIDSHAHLCFSASVYEIINLLQQVKF